MTGLDRQDDKISRISFFEIASLISLETKSCNPVYLRSQYCRSKVGDGTEARAADLFAIFREDA
jgi:hypothetical protein